MHKKSSATSNAFSSVCSNAISLSCAGLLLENLSVSGGLSRALSLVQKPQNITFQIDPLVP